nr:GGDEF domain-containing phosphodiesterase [Isachenkonia alkalipeptolytica]
MKNLYARLVKNYEELETLHEELISTEEDLEEKYKTLEENQKNLRVLKERYQLALEGSKDGLWDWNVKTDQFLFTKPEELLGYRDTEGVRRQRDWLNLIHPEDHDRVKRRMDEYLRGEAHSYESEYRIRNHKGNYLWILSKGKGIWDGEGRPLRVCGSHTNITEKKIQEKRIETMAYYDSTTKVPNRFWLGEYLEGQLKTGRKEEKVAVFLIDLDNFKKVNDILTHEMGDQFLMDIAKRLQSKLKKGEILTRFGGDEFVVVKTGDPDQRSIHATGSRILDILKEKSTVKGYQFLITGSIGIAVYPEHGGDKDTLLQNADAAMYEAKKGGRDRIRFYTREVNEKIREDIILESDLRKALEDKEFIIQIQPLVQVTTGRIIGGEALLRWNHKTKGRISPAEFISVAEDTGIIVPIGERVFKEVCDFTKTLMNQGILPVPVSVNLAVPQILHSGLLDSIHSVLKESDLEKPLLEVEITESVIMNNLDYAVTIMNNIRSMGVKVALDDFGTGYSSLSYLKNLPIDKLKIDKSFIDDIVASDSEQAIVKSVIDMAKSLGIETVAEGIEMKEQWEILRKYGCDVGQGYYMYRPMDLEDFREVLEKQMNG